MHDYTNPERPNESYFSLLGQIARSATELVRSDWHLLKEEGKVAAARTASHSAQFAVYLWIAAMSAPPFLAFLVIGLGELLGDRYWLSALIVSLTLAAAGGTMAYLTARKLKDKDLRLPRIRETLNREMRAVSGRIENLRNATKRRAS